MQPEAMATMAIYAIYLDIKKLDFQPAFCVQGLPDVYY